MTTNRSYESWKAFYLWKAPEGFGLRCQACYDCLVAAGTMQKCEWLEQDSE